MLFDNLQSLLTIGCLRNAIAKVAQGLNGIDPTDQAHRPIRRISPAPFTGTGYLTGMSAGSSLGSSR
jgi:hypothetical protein